MHHFHQSQFKPDKICMQRDDEKITKTNSMWFAGMQQPWSRVSGSECVVFGITDCFVRFSIDLKALMNHQEVGMKALA